LLIFSAVSNIADSLFSENTKGQGIICSNAGKLFVVRTNFTLHTLNVPLETSSCDLTVNGASFTSNRNDVTIGNAIRSATFDPLTVTNTVFFNNTNGVNKNGGAIFIPNQVHTLPHMLITTRLDPVQPKQSKAAILSQIV
jgi:hypothetical protein